MSDATDSAPVGPLSLLDRIAAFSETDSPIDFFLILQHWDLFLEGIKNTVVLSVLAILISAVLAIPLAISRAYRVPVANQLSYAFVYVFRGSPLLVQAYLIYYGLGQFEAVRESFLWPVLRDAWSCALIAFTLNSTAYVTEIFRGGIEAVPHGEVEAARATGMSTVQMMRRIVLPSAFRRALPMLTNESIFMFHGSVIASTITVIDVLGAGRTLNATYYLAYEGFLAATAIYMVLIYGVIAIFRRLEHHMLAHLRPRPA